MICEYIDDDWDIMNIINQMRYQSLLYLYKWYYNNYKNNNYEIWYHNQYNH